MIKSYCDIPNSSIPNLELGELYHVKESCNFIFLDSYFLDDFNIANAIYLQEEVIVTYIGVYYNKYTGKNHSKVLYKNKIGFVSSNCLFKKYL